MSQELPNYQKSLNSACFWRKKFIVPVTFCGTGGCVVVDGFGPFVIEESEEAFVVTALGSRVNWVELSVQLLVDQLPPGPGVFADGVIVHHIDDSAIGELVVLAVSEFLEHADSFLVPRGSSWRPIVRFSSRHSER